MFPSLRLRFLLLQDATSLEKQRLNITNPSTLRPLHHDESVICGPVLDWLKATGNMHKPALSVL